MERINELCGGKVCVVGDRKNLAGVMSAVVSSCSRDVPTVVLCREGASVISCAGGDDRVILVGKSRERGERFPDLLDPFLSSPEIGYDVNSIVDALASVLLDRHSVRDSNDAYWAGSANRLFRGLMLSCLLGVQLDRDFSFRHFAEMYREIAGWLPRMTEFDPGKDNKKTRFPFPSSSWTKPFLDTGEPHPLGEVLASVPPSVSQTTLNTYYSISGSVHDLLKALPSEPGTEGCYFSLSGELEATKDGVLFLALSGGMRNYSRCFLRFLLGSLEELHAAEGRRPLRVVIPDISEWEDAAGIGRFIGGADDALSVIWGVSSMIGAVSAERNPEQGILNLVARCEQRAWCRSGDPMAGDVYSRLVPRSMRSYELTSMPPGLCFLQTPDGEFDGVAIPPAPPGAGKPAVSCGAVAAGPLWRDADVTRPGRGEGNSPEADEPEEPEEAGNGESPSLPEGQIVLKYLRFDEDEDEDRDDSGSKE